MKRALEDADAARDEAGSRKVRAADSRHPAGSDAGAAGTSESPVAALLSKIRDAAWEDAEDLVELAAQFQAACKDAACGTEDWRYNDSVEALTYSLEISPEVVGPLLMVLEVLTRRPEGVRAARAAASLRVVLRALRAPSLEVTARAAGLGVLANLAGDNAEEVPAILEAGALGLVREELCGQPGAASVQGQGIRFLRNITEGDEECSKVMSYGFVDCAVAAMNQFPEDEALQVAGCGLLSNLAHFVACNELCGRSLSQRGAAAVAAGALKRHPYHEGIQECGLNFFRSIADTDDGLRAVLAGGRVGLAVAALKSHPTNKAVLDAALGVLVIVALNDDGQNVMLGGSSVPVTVQVLDAHPDCESLQEAGLSLIQNVTFECQEGCEVALRHNAVRAATRALGLFRGTADIQEVGLGILRNLMDLKEGRKEVLDIGAAELATTALKTHPDHEGIRDAAVGLLQPSILLNSSSLVS